MVSTRRLWVASSPEIADPRELRNLADQKPEIVAELTELLERQLAAEQAAAFRGFVPSFDATLEELRHLGYIR